MRLEVLEHFEVLLAVLERLEKKAVERLMLIPKRVDQMVDLVELELVVDGVGLPPKVAVPIRLLLHCR